MQKEPQNKLSKWLELLQQESWQLELIISGFAIFLVGSLYDPIQEFGMQVSVASQGISNDFIINMPFMVLTGAWFFLLLNLIFHVVLRGLWISTIGLRYVSGGINFDELNFHPKFDRFLRKNTTDYDEYIERLEKLCSVVFAFTFMLIFMFLALGLWSVFLSLVIDFFINDFIGEIFPKAEVAVGLVLIVLIILSSILFFIDFITLGWLKRKKWAAKIYYPFYRLYSFITLAFIYRPIYYNLIDNKFGKRLAFLLVPYMFTVILLSSVYIDFHPYYPPSAYQRDNLNLRTSYYDDMRDNQNQIIRKASIPSKYVSNGFIELFLNYNPYFHDNSMDLICPDLKPFNETGLKTTVIKINMEDITKTQIDSALLCIGQLYDIYVNDSLHEESVFRFHKHAAHEERGVLTILDVDYLPRGEHILKIDHQRERKDTLYTSTLSTIPFWKE